MKRSVQTFAGFFTVVFAAAAPAQTASYPARLVRIVVPAAPGGGSDIQARLLGKAFQESMGQPFIVENRPGASGIIGTELVTKAAPDGHTFLVSSALLATNAAIYKKLPFDASRDLAPVGQISFAPQILVVHPSVPAASVREFLALAKKHPGKVNAGSSGTGSANHLALEMLKQRAGLDITHIPYKSGGVSITAVMSGEVAIAFSGVVTALPPVRAKRVRALAVTSLRRSFLLPDVPALAELYPGFESANWYAIFVPAGTPPAVVSRLNAELLKALKSREMLDFIAREGAEPVGSSPQELSVYFQREVARYAEVIRIGKIQVE